MQYNCIQNLGECLYSSSNSKVSIRIEFCGLKFARRMIGSAGFNLQLLAD
jgi:hypothetical protein